MVRALRLLILLALLHALLPTTAGFAQVPKDSTDSQGSASQGSTDPLPGFPQPLDTPRSLMEPEPTFPQHGNTPVLPYFQPDVLLDPPQLPQPGWFADVEVGILDPHFKNRLTETLPLGLAPPTTIHAPGAALDWTVAPRFEAGYRLDSGFGAFALSYRFLNSTGGETGLGPDGPAALSSELVCNIIDLDYVTHEFSLWPHWDMQWRLGVRTSFLYYNAQDRESAAVALTGSGLIFERNTNYFVGAGPHVGVGLDRHFEDSGLAFTVKSDAAGITGQTRQGFFAQDTTGATAQTHDVAVQDIPMVTFDVGLSWQPIYRRNMQFFAGYQYEYWWNAARMSSTSSRGELADQGFLLRAAIDY